MMGRSVSRRRIEWSKDLALWRSRPGHLSALFLLILALGCDSQKDPLADPFESLFCQTLANCTSQRNTTFGMLGDSWTDLALGQPLIHDLRDYLQEDYGFGITGSTTAGQTLSTVLRTGLHLEVIRRSGPGLRYMLISLGGNDMIFGSSAFVADPTAERNRVLALIQANMLRLIREGNLYKQEQFGGPPLVWFWHGYDYSNPDNVAGAGGFVSDTGCRARLKASGYTDAVIDTELPRNVDAYAAMLRHTATLESSLRPIDLRGILGGPSFSNRDLMFDCIHPSTVGFGMLAASFVFAVDQATGGVR